MENKDQKLGLEPAFACEFMSDNGIDGYWQKGISKRFYAACQIAPSVISSLLSSDKSIQGLIGVMKETNSTQEAVIVGMIYEYVDELIKQENE